MFEKAEPLLNKALAQDTREGRTLNRICFFMFFANENPDIAQAAWTLYQCHWLKKGLFVE